MTQAHGSDPLGFGRPAGHEEVVWTRANVVGVTIAAVLFFFLLAVTYENYLRDQAAEQNGLELAEASQNARSGLALIAEELRGDDAGLPRRARILVASQYRITFARDADGDRRLDPEEVVTYFLDPNWRDAPITSKPNPYGFVLRRKVGAAGDSLATPTLGQGEIVAYGLSQRSGDHVTTKDIPLFSYRDSLGSELELLSAAPTDPAGVFFGRTVSGLAGAGLPQRGANTGIRAVRVRLVAETKERDRETGRYDRVTVGQQVALREAPGETANP